jgi:RHS repeat-associated protein
LQTIATGQITIKRSGFIYVYTSNESLEDVFFDNLVVQHFGGPVLEETHYYPFGLTMEGISSRALTSLENLYRFNEGSEYNKDLDLNLYETPFRSYDPQIGRFHQIDGLSDLDYEWSPYSYAHNNPLLLNDPLGLSVDSTGKDNQVSPIVLKEFVVYGVQNSGPSLLNSGGLSYLPIVGPINDAINDFKNGHYVSGGLNVIFGISDIFPLGGIASKGLRFGIRFGSRFFKATKTGSKIAVQFGKTENQISHAFRHTDALGLNRSLVQSTIQNHFKTVSSQVVAGKPFNQIIEIGGQRIQYTAFKLSDGTFNIGRIHGIK